MKRIIIILTIVLSSSILYSQSSIVFDVGTTIDVGSGADVCANTITVNGTYTGSGSFCGGPLPVELISFTAKAVGESVILNWQTATEVNNYGFEIERCVAQISNLCNNWETVGFLEGHGNSNSPKDYSFIDAGNNSVAEVSRSYRLKQIDIDGAFEYSDIISIELEIAKEFKLAQNFPNPFNPSTSISYTLPNNGFVTLKVYNTIGEEVAVLINQNIEAGTHVVTFNASNLPTGAYFYRISAENYSDTKKMLLIK